MFVNNPRQPEKVQSTAIKLYNQTTHPAVPMTIAPRIIPNDHESFDSSSSSSLLLLLLFSISLDNNGSPNPPRGAGATPDFDRSVRVNNAELLIADIVCHCAACYLYKLSLAVRLLSSCGHGSAVPFDRLHCIDSIVGQLHGKFIIRRQIDFFVPFFKS